MAPGDSSLLNFTIARRKKAGVTPSGVTAALALPSTVRSSVTISPTEENPDSLSSAAHFLRFSISFFHFPFEFLNFLLHILIYQLCIRPK